MNKKEIIIITLVIGLSLIFILVILPQIYYILVFFNVEYWLRVIILLIIIPFYFGFVIWLLLSEINIWFKKEETIKKLEITKGSNDDNDMKVKTKDIEIKVRLIYNSIKKILVETDKFSIKELANMLEIKYQEVYEIVKNLISENMISGVIDNDNFKKIEK
ncbi:MAG: PCI domain-containing protein [Candidatus Helarchaeota archaeon]